MELTKSFRKYLRLYGPHFNKLLCQFAVSMMEKEDGPIQPYTKEEIDSKLKKWNIQLQYNKYEDYIFVANMCKADFLGKSIVDEQHLCMYIKDVIDDPDGYTGQPFYRWLADMDRIGITIDWEEFV